MEPCIVAVYRRPWLSGADARQPLPIVGQRCWSLQGRTVHIGETGHVFTDQRHRPAAERAEMILSS